MKEKIKDPAAVALGSRGGKQTVKKRGRRHFVKLGMRSGEVRRAKSERLQKLKKLHEERVDVKFKP